MKTTERLDKILAEHGFGTRKDVKKLLHSKVVTVDGSIVTSADFQVDPFVSEIFVDGERVIIRNHVYLMMNKCADVVCSVKDGEHATVFDLLDDSYRGRLPGGDLHLVGRLDIDTEGLLILTTDGKLTHRLTSPKTHVSKTYFVRLRDKVTGDPSKNQYVEAFKKGLEIPPEGSEDGFTSESAFLEWKSDDECELTIYEGKYHQVKRMFAVMNNKVIYLKRISCGSLKLDENLKTGGYRELSEEELDLLQ